MGQKYLDLSFKFESFTHRLKVFLSGTNPNKRFAKYFMNLNRNHIPVVDVQTQLHMYVTSSNCTLCTGQSQESKSDLQSYGLKGQNQIVR